MARKKYTPELYPKADREPPILAGRVPPNDLGAEAACLASALLDEAAADIIISELEPDHFYSDNHRLIFDALKGLRDDRVAIDLVNVATWLRNRELIQRVGGSKYLGELVGDIPAVANVAGHARTVRDKSQARHLISTAQKIASEGYGAIPDHGEWVAKCEKRLFEATRGHEKRHPELISKYVVAEHESAINPKIVDVKRVLTGFEDFDKEIGGWFRGDLITYAARPGMGKSAAVQRKIRNICMERWAPSENEDEGQLRYECLLFSPEMPKEQVAQRLLSQESGVDLGKIRKGGPFQPKELREMKDATERLARIHIHVDDTPGISILEVVSKVRRFVAAVEERGREVGAVVIDYLQKCSWPSGEQNRATEVGKMTNALKNLAMELMIPVVANSQLNRGVDSRDIKDRRPKLTDLRESGDIEQDCDLVVFIYREKYYTASADKMAAEFCVAKQRNGQTGDIKVAWWGWCTRFLNIGDA